MKKPASAAVSLAAFSLAAALLFAQLSGFSRENTQRQKQALEEAISRNLLLSYALEGRYPATLEELLREHPIHYDRDLFFIDYRLQGSNILPDITILEMPR